MRIIPCKKAMASSNTVPAERRMASFCSDRKGSCMTWKSLVACNQVHDNCYSTENDCQCQCQHIETLKAQLAAFAAPPAPHGSSIATRFHSSCQCFGSPEATQKERHQQWAKLEGALNEVALVEAYSPGRLGLYQSFHLGNKDGYELEGD